MKTTTPKRPTSPYEAVTRKVLELLDQGTIPWQRAWNARTGPPVNGATGRRYAGFNVFMLSLMHRAYPWWFTLRQARELDMHVRKGEKTTWVTFWKPWRPKSEAEAAAAAIEAAYDDNRDVLHLTDKRPRLVIRAYMVFNLEQLDGPGVDAFKEKHKDDIPASYDHDPIPACEALVRNIPDPPTIRFQGNQPRYRPSEDTIYMTPMDQFPSLPSYYSTLYHELTHSTGAPHRLGRGGVETAAPFGSPVYSQEELVAEMGAAFLCAHTGLTDPTLQSSAAYIQHWKQFLSDQPRALLTAGAQAEKAARYLLGELQPAARAA